MTKQALAMETTPQLMPAQQFTPPMLGENIVRDSSVKLTGLPIGATVQDVLAFFAQHDIVHCISDKPGAVKLSSEEATVQMFGPTEAKLAQCVLHGQHMRACRVEVFPCDLSACTLSGSRAISLLPGFAEYQAMPGAGTFAPAWSVPTPPWSVPTPWHAAPVEMPADLPPPPLLSAFPTWLDAVPALPAGLGSSQVGEPVKTETASLRRLFNFLHPEHGVGSVPLHGGTHFGGINTQ